MSLAPEILPHAKKHGVKLEHIVDTVTSPDFVDKERVHEDYKNNRIIFIKKIPDYPDNRPHETFVVIEHQAGRPVIVSARYQRIGRCNYLQNYNSEL
ncbi:MAG: hypothetical protein OH319_02345 [Candidatus Parvarchaeota archaeon]|nr:hypothetical protein [Candidatus Jingweiarchaeum tengchongense]MCW1298208.1 hypothetical protein [Candidatus Jingweiarchaeum tengchongense]MCW1300006.1 hypothetical protein [Candidatus Jingweiarchaeum tengchongense]MCW1305004.1 hypothetical protein [Candidatus Jingweiarchaeum tengchongense]MCW1305445.1 hypothetical protein [Candidatus Jingweiarchaeum tengchongense]